MNPIIRRTSEQFRDLPSGVLTSALIVAGLAIILIAIFSNSNILKAIVLAYIVLP